MLVGAMNPCPCGYLGDPQRHCRCSPEQVSRYRGRISGPLLDRLDLQVQVPAVRFQELAGSEDGQESSQAMRARVLAAREKQRARFPKGKIFANAHMTPKLLKEHCALTEETRRLLEAAMEKLALSARAYSRILKIARTIADLTGSARILPPHVGEAVQYRSLDRPLG